MTIEIARKKAIMRDECRLTRILCFPEQRSRSVNVDSFRSELRVRTRVADDIVCICRRNMQKEY